MRAKALCTTSTMLLALLAVSAPAWAQSSPGGTAAPDPSTTAAPAPAPTAPAGDPTQGAPTDPSAPPSTGGSPFGTTPQTVPHLVVPGAVAKIVNGYAAAPSLAPPAVQAAIWTANEIVGKPYVWGGGHSAFVASGYDCSGAVSYAMHGGNLLTTPMDSTDFMRWGLRGAGQWITVFANSGHAYVNIAGIRLDTSAANDPSGARGTRWRPLRKTNRGYRLRHPLGL